MVLIPGKKGYTRMASPEIPKGRMSGTERDSRSRLTQIISGSAIVRGTLTTRERVCGKANCKCTRGEKHVGLYLVASKDGKLRQLFVPQSYEARLRKWLAQYKEAENLLEQISDLYWEKIQKREE